MFIITAANLRCKFQKEGNFRKKGSHEQLCLIFRPSLAADCRYEGLNLIPSIRMAEGRRKMNEMTIITKKRLLLSSESSFLTIALPNRSLREGCKGYSTDDSYQGRDNLERRLLPNEQSSEDNGEKGLHSFDGVGE
ncbi:hypothetical protein SAY87_011605 [Trapa incisa]|uniref:Uncharacterized protein n=1 Tax=Trapa incisa TaxID=236973 RepID=A0AAN7GR18_9MYRT|nr:hypothetical protein SAY87_011605 [Trapa incisa]